MSEPKPIWIADYSPSINNEPLSTKQLHELITSQSMTIDRLLGEIAKRDDDIKELQEMISEYVRFCDGYKKMCESYRKIIKDYEGQYFTKDTCDD